MKPTLHELQNLCPEIPSALTEEHLTRLDDNYFDFFQPAQVQSHLRALASLSSAKPSSVIFEPAAGRRMACTVMAYDYPALFSLITGLLAASGFNILTGEISPCPSPGRRRRMIIDYFVGEIDASADVTTWPTVFEKTSLTPSPCWKRKGRRRKAPGQRNGC